MVTGCGFLGSSPLALPVLAVRACGVGGGARAGTGFSITGGQDLGSPVEACCSDFG